MVGVVITALGMKKTLQQVADTDHYRLAEPLHGMPAWALADGAGLFCSAPPRFSSAPRAGGRRC
ncbi:hypothetical protein [Streptomyces sp. DSM 40750]|uniref:hypothetical protein n=1 Tax=Streptomyces sp. DSM 40750 TaxID=2801030 RepID=UPI00214AAFA8|nr:hypothetical protein [Streptomyces sp. DSM 40750]UUU24549.1 hypothetical protein JIX55_32230 [Streptomyces sp. DSM 40750]